MVRVFLGRHLPGFRAARISGRSALTSSRRLGSDQDLGHERDFEIYLIQQTLVILIDRDVSGLVVVLAAITSSPSDSTV